MIKCEMERHFGVWANGTGLDVQRLERDAPGMRAYRAFPGRWTFFSDVNGAVAKWAWERFPYRTVPYAEDQLLGREVIEAGLAKVYHPDARVLHSHDYPPLTFFRRYFDEFRSLREVLGHVEAVRWRGTPMTIRGLIGHDKRWLRRHGVHGSELVAKLLVSARHHTLRQTGAIVGSRSDRLSPPLRKLLSLEGRATFTPSVVEDSPLLARRPSPAPSRSRSPRTGPGASSAAPTRSSRSRPSPTAARQRRRGRLPGSSRRGRSAPAATRRSSA